MKLLISALVLTLSLSAFANPKRMPKACELKIQEEIGPDGSVQSSTAEIILELKRDWRMNPEKEIAHYDDCGASDYFYIDVNKATCEIKMDFGDSDGECN